MWHATSDAERRDILNTFPGANVIVIPNGINITDYQQSPGLSRAQYFVRFGLSLPEDTKVIVSMGRLHEVKAFPLLIQSFALLLEEMPKVALLIAGRDDGVGAQLRTLINDLELAENAFLLGDVSGDKKTDFMSGADLFALTSYSENFGNV